LLGGWLHVQQFPSLLFSLVDSGPDLIRLKVGIAVVEPLAVSARHP
jgi:hypothetical protein